MYQVKVYVPSTDFRMHLNPAIQGVWYYDASNTAGQRFEGAGSTSGGTLLSDLTDRNTGTGSGTAMDSGATGDRIYILTAQPIGGLNVDVGSANGNGGTLTVKYWNGSAFVTTSATDNTTVFSVDGTITWSAPSAELPALHLPSYTDTDRPNGFGFWYEVSWGTALDNDTELLELNTLNKDTNRGYYYLGQEYTVSLDRRVIGAVELVLASGTDTADLTWIAT